MANPKEGTQQDYQIPKVVLHLESEQKLPSIDAISQTLRRALDEFNLKQNRNQEQLTQTLQIHLQEAHRNVSLETISAVAKYFSNGIWMLLNAPPPTSMNDFATMIENDFGQNLASRFWNLVFVRRGITSLEELTQLEARDLKGFKIGEKLIFAIRSTLAKIGLRLRGDLDADPLTQRFFLLVEKRYSSNLASFIAGAMRRNGILNVEALALKYTKDLKMMKFGPAALEAIPVIISLLKTEQDGERA
jgi:hypothetical protein